MIIGFAPEKRRMFHQWHPCELDLGGLALFQWDVGHGRPRTSPMMIMTSSSLMDILGGRLGSIGMCGRLEKPKEG